VIKHIVLWRLKDHALGASKRQNAEKLKVLLEALRDNLPEIKHLEVGVHACAADAASHSADVALYSEFASWDDLEAYQKHPEHLKVAGFVQEIRLDRHVVDYEV
jgi:Stress responsive A/B Barrel Domain